MTSEEGYKQTNYFNSHQRNSMDQSRIRRSLSNGELEVLDKPIYPVRQHILRCCKIPSLANGHFATKADAAGGHSH